jgi:hypothetical protein
MHQISENIMGCFTYRSERRVFIESDNEAGYFVRDASKTPLVHFLKQIELLLKHGPTGDR